MKINSLQRFAYYLIYSIVTFNDHSYFGDDATNYMYWYLYIELIFLSVETAL